jgi:acetyltransferase-like isoleucine patch superfamily enzyme
VTPPPPGPGFDGTSVSRDERGIHLAHDWYPGRVPANVALGPDAYIETSMGFDGFLSTESPGLALGAASGAYSGASFLVGPRGRVTVGDFAVLNGVTIVCEERVTIGAHVHVARSTVVTDVWRPTERGAAGLAARRAALRAASSDPSRPFPAAAAPRPVTIEDAAWIGFGAVVLPGVTLGRGCVVAARCVVDADVPPYAIVAGSPPRVVRTLDPDDTPAARERALRECLRAR